MCYLRLQNSTNWKVGCKETTLHSIDDVLTPAANWVLGLRDMEKSLEETTSVNIIVDDTKTMLGYLLFPLWKQISLAHKMWSQVKIL